MTLFFKNGSTIVPDSDEDQCDITDEIVYFDDQWWFATEFGEINAATLRDIAAHLDDLNASELVG